VDCSDGSSCCHVMCCGDIAAPHRSASTWRSRWLLANSLGIHGRWPVRSGRKLHLGFPRQAINSAGGSSRQRCFARNRWPLACHFDPGAWHVGPRPRWERPLLADSGHSADRNRHGDAKVRFDPKWSLMPQSGTEGAASGVTRLNASSQVPTSTASHCRRRFLVSRTFIPGLHVCKAWLGYRPALRWRRAGDRTDQLFRGRAGHGVVRRRNVAARNLHGAPIITADESSERMRPLLADRDIRPPESPLPSSTRNTRRVLASGRRLAARWHLRALHRLRPSPAPHGLGPSIRVV